MHQNQVDIDVDVYDWYKKILASEKELIEHKNEVADLASLHWASATAKAAYPRLREYQKQAVNFLVKARRTILGDEPGLGKTATALVATQCTDRASRILVVCPASLKEWWAQEAQAWLGSSVTVTIATSGVYAQQFTDYLIASCKGSNLFIVNYELLLRMPELARLQWDWVIADEAHRIKNPYAKTTKAFMNLKGLYSVMITATPLANQPQEMWSMLHYCRPAVVPAFGFFKTFYQKEIVLASGWTKPAGPRHPGLLRREHEPVMIRRLKSEVEIQLPPKLHQKIPLWMLPEQVTAYRQMVHDSLIELEDGTTILADEPAVVMLRLRQVTSGLATLGGEDISAKLDTCMELLADRDEEQIVFFTMFRATAESLVRRCSMEGVTAELFISGVKEETEAIKRFQTGASRVFVATVQKGGVGLNLQAAATLVFIDKHWNPALQAQAEDRIHRIGQERPCLIISLHHRHTIDDYVEKVLTQKLSWSSQIVKQELAQHLEDSLRYL